MKNRRAFTLIETILALSIATIVMFGGSVTLFNMLSVSERLERSWTLKSHADGVEKFLRNSIKSAIAVHPERIKNVLARYPSNNLFLAQPPESVDSDDYILAFEINEPHPLFVSPTGFSAEKICYLMKDDKTLSLIWRHANAEFENSEAGIYKTALSPFIEEITYFYDDETGWEEENEIDDTDSSKLPYYIKIVFARGEEKIERIIPLFGLIDPSLIK